MLRLDVSEVVREVLALARNDLLASGITVKTELPTNVHPVLGDRIQLQQLMLNLIMNGIDAMSAIDDRPRELVIKSAELPEGVLIQVQDSGKARDCSERIAIPISFPAGTRRSDTSRRISETRREGRWRQRWGCLCRCRAPQERSCPAAALRIHKLPTPGRRCRRARHSDQPALED